MTKLITGKYRGVVLQGLHPSFDVICALTVLMERLTGQLEWPSAFSLSFFSSNEEPDANIRRRWDGDRLCAINVGTDRFTQRKFGSVTEMVAHDLNIDPDSQSFTDVRRLIRLVNKNNEDQSLNRTAGRQNIPFLTKEASKPSMFLVREDVVEAAAHVIFTHRKFTRLAGRALPRTWVRIKEDPKFASLNQLRVKHIVHDENPFTLHTYLFQMFMLGMDRDVIMQRLDFWLQADKRARELHKVAMERVKSLPRKPFTVDGQLAVEIVTADDRMARSFFALDTDRPALVFSKHRRRNHFQLLTDRRYHKSERFRNSMERLLRHLNAAEEKAGGKATWFLDRAQWGLYFGSSTTPNSPESKLKPGQIKTEAEAILKFPPPGSKESAKEATKGEAKAKAAPKAETKKSSGAKAKSAEAKTKDGKKAKASSDKVKTKDKPPKEKSREAKVHSGNGTSKPSSKSIQTASGLKRSVEAAARRTGPEVGTLGLALAKAAEATKKKPVTK